MLKMMMIIGPILPKGTEKLRFRLGFLYLRMTSDIKVNE